MKSWVQRTTQPSTNKSMIFGITQQCSNNRKAYYYVSVHTQKKDAFLQAMNGRHPFKLDHYGQVIYSGYQKPNPHELVLIKRRATQ